MQSSARFSKTRKNKLLSLWQGGGYQKMAAIFLTSPLKKKFHAELKAVIRKKVPSGISFTLRLRTIL